MKHLVITADDFGASSEVNEAVEAAHRHGVLTAASLMIAAPAADEAILLARRLPSLCVGLHVVLVEGTPLLPSSAVSSLIDSDGAFRADLGAYGARLCTSRQARREVAAEITAQFSRFRDSGLTLDHCNAHKHFHLHPLIGRLILDIGRRFGLGSVRVPIEPRRVLLQCEASVMRSDMWLTAPFARLLQGRVRAAGLLAPRQVFGLRWSGQMTQARLASVIAHLPDGLSEIYLHPATGSYPGSAPSYQYREELAALMSPEVIAACRRSGATMGGYADFPLPSRPYAAATAPNRSTSGI